MRRVLILLCFAAPALAAQAAPSTDLPKLQGSWSMVSGMAAGTPMPASFAVGMRRELKGDKLTITLNGQLYFAATITLHPSATPKQIDYQMTGGFSAGNSQLGIYRFAGDTVWFCFGAPGAARPTEFKSETGDGRTLTAWVKAKP